MPKVQGPSARISWVRASHPDRALDPVMPDTQILIQAAMAQCNSTISTIVATQQELRKDVSPATAAAFRTCYRDLELRRRAVMERCHQVQVVSFTLETLTLDILVARIAQLFDMGGGPRSTRPVRPGFDEALVMNEAGLWPPPLTAGSAGILQQERQHSRNRKPICTSLIVATGSRRSAAFRWQYERTRRDGIQRIRRA